MSDVAPKNLLLLHCHDLGRFLGAYGERTVETPHLDALAARSVLFERAFATSPQCSPARASLFTGTYPQRNGVLGLTHPPFNWDLADPSTHLATRLHDAGYRTHLIGVHHESKVLGDDQIAARLGFDIVESHGSGGAQADGSGDIVADRAIRALSDFARGAVPFYLQVGFYEPHRIPADDQSGLMGFVGDYIEPDSSRGISVPPYLRDDELTRREIAELQGAVRYMDHHVGRVLGALDELRLSESTIVVFTTDHGLALPRAKGTLYDAGLEVALMIRDPSRPPWEGRRVSAMTSHLDVRPTVLELLDLTDDLSVDGQSMLPLIASSDTVGAEHLFGQLTYHDIFNPKRSVRTERHKLIVSFANAPTPMDPSQSWYRRSAIHDLAGGGIRTNPLAELYDLEADPGETRNLIADDGFAEVTRELAGQLLAWMTDVDDPLLRPGFWSPQHHAALRFLGAHPLGSREVSPVLSPRHFVRRSSIPTN